MIGKWSTVKFWKIIFGLDYWNPRKFPHFDRKKNPFLHSWHCAFTLFEYFFLYVTVAVEKLMTWKIKEKEKSRMRPEKYDYVSIHFDSLLHFM